MDELREWLENQLLLCGKSTQEAITYSAVLFKLEEIESKRELKA
jgi:hypothetical protein